MVPLSPSASLSFGSNLSLTVSESDTKPPPSAKQVIYYKIFLHLFFVNFYLLNLTFRRLGV